jgi:hypothetical protein
LELVKKEEKKKKKKKRTNENKCKQTHCQTFLLGKAKNSYADAGTNPAIGKQKDHGSNS